MKIYVLIFIFLLSLIFLRVYGLVWFFNSIISTTPELKTESSCIITDLYSNPIADDGLGVAYQIQNVCIKSNLISTILIGMLIGSMLNKIKLKTVQEGV